MCDVLFSDYFYDLFYFLMHQSFGWVDFQWMTKNGESIKNTFICVLEMNGSFMKYIMTESTILGELCL